MDGWMDRTKNSAVHMNLNKQLDHGMKKTKFEFDSVE